MVERKSNRLPLSKGFSFVLEDEGTLKVYRAYGDTMLEMAE